LLFCALIAIPSPAKADPIVIASPSFHIFGGGIAAPGILQGFALTAMTARLDQVVVDPRPGSRATDFSGVLSFEGFADSAVPEPGTLSLLGTAIACCAGRAIRSRRRQRHHD
jgi:hypothetical protein